MAFYVDFDHYKSIYGDRAIAEIDFNFFIRTAQRELDRATTGKLKFAFPTDESAVESVKDCLCELVNVFYKIDKIESSNLESQGTTIDETTGAIRGRVMTSKSSGSESMSFSATAARADDSTYMRAAAEPNAKKQLLKDTVDEFLTGVDDNNGINLLYLGPYPGRRI